MVSDISTFRFGVSSASLGMAKCHTLESKFSALQKAGYAYAQVGFGDYVSWVRSRRPGLPPSSCPPEWKEADEPDPSDEEIWQALYQEAPELISLATNYGLRILALQPLNQFDGWPEGSVRAEWVRRKAERWLPLCSKLEVELLQVGANDYAEADASDEKTAEDMRWLAELGAKQNPPVKIAYEVWCFSKRVNTWEHTWKIVQLGDHPNLGLCLDVAHFPLAPSYGWVPTTGEGWSDSQYNEMISRLKKVPGNKIFYLEISDVLKPVRPLGQGSPFDAWREKNRPARGDIFVWTVCGRPLPYVGKNAGRSVDNEDDMGGARVFESVQAVLSTGFKGPIMWEFFEAMTMEKDDPSIPDIYAQACVKAETQLKARLPRLSE
ncbi:hypothetical protein CNG02985 [Cryptococcus deneoformans JEC21]|uniref:Xylose isomerase-like TIM barrel domain-containing protein n=1 Tax=Cryptococcus deneoformans (strain JEC21 / ATCC MYA-565) TaxID=214684 RepID=A0A0S2M5Z4_CRYD1|nr:hypothetical protein CNG02985 [Cryptococcus neoformans var. neoformans JEC21]ALO69296.1 hypothetical protein CNG02985 [Cryptococcus neoformans var. neoformans JEC21]